ncbi:putative triacylglycerol lipase [Acanthamoeba polyphaga mimivirus]|uniref:Triacylglycerol lipase n=1 Tax=Acanthamoeba polyphaga mimivirus Kroon TaxID=3069720 RepID=A0A0G2Y6Q1_9VIRU|nr:putative triacylglycerol lipase [Acanthamoeba polyphaga mimivirus]AKI80259.1 putative triacylglycerol lipase [Acanthamoeba polyphaga mimivirus Kroon]
MTDYQSKYSLYKRKYLSLKQKQNGGNNIADNIDPIVKKFVDSIKDAKPVYEVTPEEARKNLNSIQSDQSYKTTVDIENVVVNDKNVNATIIRPKGNRDRLPVVFYVHGAGWVMGGLQTHGRFVSEIVNKANVTVIFVNYSLAPEKKFPTQIVECYDALVYFYSNAQRYNLDFNNIIVVGDSVGGNMATVLAMLTREKTGPRFKYQILLYPVISAAMNTQSYQTYENGPWLSKKSMEWFYEQYTEPNQNLMIPSISPINATDRTIQYLPPTLLVVDENDVLRDEGEAYAHRLSNLGVPTKSVRVLGTIHDFMLLNPLVKSPATKLTLEIVVNEIKRITTPNKN